MIRTKVSFAQIYIAKFTLPRWFPNCWCIFLVIRIFQQVYCTVICAVSTTSLQVRQNISVNFFWKLKPSGWRFMPFGRHSQPVEVVYFLLHTAAERVLQFPELSNFWTLFLCDLILRQFWQFQWYCKGRLSIYIDIIEVYL